MLCAGNGFVKDVWSYLLAKLNVLCSVFGKLLKKIIKDTQIPHHSAGFHPSCPYFASFERPYTVTLTVAMLHPLYKTSINRTFATASENSLFHTQCHRHKLVSSQQ